MSEKEKTGINCDAADAGCEDYLYDFQNGSHWQVDYFGEDKLFGNIDDDFNLVFRTPNVEEVTIGAIPPKDPYCLYEAICDALAARHRLWESLSNRINDDEDAEDDGRPQNSETQALVFHKALLGSEVLNLVIECVQKRVLFLDKACQKVDPHYALTQLQMALNHAAVLANDLSDENFEVETIVKQHQQFRALRASGADQVDGE